jgi:tripartite-type tricarboxylate transporter receptor subunit TctC
MIRRFLLCCSLASFVVTVFGIVASPAAFAQGYPAKPVRIIVPFGPGGAADSLPRLVGQKLSEMWGQPVLVENRAGAAGNLGMEQAARSAPDGYTLVSAPVGNIAINPHLYPKLSFDVFKDFTPITLVASVQNVIVVHPSVPAQTLPQFIDYARANPRKIDFASGGNGTQAHMGGELLKAMSGIDMVHIAYKGVGDAVKDLVGGQTNMMVAQIPSVLSFIQAGRLRALAVASPRRVAALPDVPTAAEAAQLPGFEAVSWYALMGPAGMPREVAAKIQADVAKAVQSADVREKLRGLGAEPHGSTTAELVSAMRADFDRYGAIVKRIGLKLE